MESFDKHDLMLLLTVQVIVVILKVKKVNGIVSAVNISFMTVSLTFMSSVLMTQAS